MVTTGESSCSLCAASLNRRSTRRSSRTCLRHRARSRMRRGRCQSSYTTGGSGQGARGRVGSVCSVRLSLFHPGPSLECPQCQGRRATGSAERARRSPASIAIGWSSLFQTPWPTGCLSQSAQQQCLCRTERRRRRCQIGSAAPKKLSRCGRDQAPEQPGEPGNRGEERECKDGGLASESTDRYTHVCVCVHALICDSPGSDRADGGPALAN